MRRALLRASRAAACHQQTGCYISVQPAVSQAGAWQRSFSQPAEADHEEEQVSEKVQKLASDIMGLSVLECSQLSNMLREKLGVPRGAAMPMMGMPMAMPAAGPAAGAAGAAEAAEPKEEKKEKTEFDVKLESFTPEGKIKVIKEIRAITSLGLKEAKELVGGWQTSCLLFNVVCLPGCVVHNPHEQQQQQQCNTQQDLRLARGFPTASLKQPQFIAPAVLQPTVKLLWYMHVPGAYCVALNALVAELLCS